MVKKLPEVIYFFLILGMCLIVTGDVDRGLTNVNTRSLRQFGTGDKPNCSSLESKV